MRILGVDPGLTSTGYGVIETKDGPIKLLEAGFIKTSPREPISERLLKIFNGLDALIREYKPSVMVLEKVYSHYKHPTTAILMGHARGVICVLCGIHNVRLVNYGSTRIKKSISGHGRASKEQVQRLVQSFLSLSAPPEPVDLSDALALAISHVYIEKKDHIFA